MSYDPELDEDNELVEDSESEFESDAIEDDPFYDPYLANENLMNIGRIIRYEISRVDTTGWNEGVDDDDDNDDEEVPVNTRVVPESESLPPPPPPIDVTSVETVQDPNKLGLTDFEGLPRYRLSFMCVRYFEWTGIRNIATASSITNDALMRALCQIPRDRVVPDCAICSYPLWDSLETKCCSQSLCIHCVNRCLECPYCRSVDY